MKKIYGYKESELFALANEVKVRGETPLARVFEKFAKTHGKAKGTVRNMYYALAKACKDQDYSKDYLNGGNLNVSVIEKFTLEEEKSLLKKVILGINAGKSVRKIIIEISNGDMKKALRLQNKYRNLKADGTLYSTCVNELIASGLLEKDFATKIVKPKLSGGVYETLQKEIDKLIERIKSGYAKENEKLKSRISVLEMENLSLKRQSYFSDAEKKRVIDFLKKEDNGAVN